MKNENVPTVTLVQKQQIIPQKRHTEQEIITVAEICAAYRAQPSVQPPSGATGRTVKKTDGMVY